MVICPIGGGSYKINFETNGGDLISSKSICSTCGDAMMSVSLPTPKKDGYNFVGWYKDKNLTNPVDVSQASKVGNYVSTGKCVTEKTIYAKWEKEVPKISVDSGTYEIIFDTNGGNFISSKSVCIDCAEADVFVSLPTPQKPGYVLWDGIKIKI